MEDVKTGVQESTEPKTEAVAETVVTASTQPGEKTDPALLLKSLQKEREEKKRLEEALLARENEMETLKQSITPEVFSDEGLVLKKQIDTLSNQLKEKAEQDLLKSLEEKFPALKDKRSEFEQYRLDNAGMKLETVSKSFLVENDLLEQPHSRKGLESSGGGGRTVPSTDLSADEIKKIRETDSRRYIRLVKEGKIKF